MPGCAGAGAGAACIATLLGRPPGALNTGAVAGVDAGAEAARLGLLCADDAFCRTMLASLSRMMLGTAGFADGAAATLLPEPSEAKRLGGGLPGGVVEAFVGLGAFSLSLKELTIEVGNVWPFSQISTSFFIFSYG
jgi:hypothetical protein